MSAKEFIILLTRADFYYQEIDDHRRHLEEFSKMREIKELCKDNSEFNELFDAAYFYYRRSRSTPEYTEVWVNAMRKHGINASIKINNDSSYNKYVANYGDLYE